MGFLTRLLFLVQLLTYISQANTNENNKISNYMQEGQELLDNHVIPHLKQKYKNMGENYVGHFNLNNLRICKCTAHWGCDTGTSGWVPNVLEMMALNPVFKKKWEDTCVTDGECVQMAVAVEGDVNQHHSYACSDVNHKKHDFFTALQLPSDQCRNETTDKKETLWTCCNTGNYCANQTLLEPNYKLTVKTVLNKMNDWRIIVLVVLVFIVLLVGLIYLGYSRFKRRGRQCVPVEPPVVYNGNGDGNVVIHPIVDSDEVSRDVPSTVQTTLDQHGLRNNPNARLFNQIESTDGTSGAGPLQLQPRSLGHCVRRDRVIGQGRYGAVFHGTYNNEEVALKAFHSSDEVSYSTEVQIYQIGMLRHPNVLRYIANDRVDTGSVIELWLVTEYHAPGSLYDYLQNNVLNLRTCYDMIRSTANGLAFLHHEMKTTSGLTKPAIVHRDLKTRNIMVKEDLTCAIGDFGLSVTARITGASPSDGENERNGLDADDAGDRFGTVRYLAPEVLSGTMGPNRFEAYRMADVYSFMLCCWEIMSRTSDDNIVAVPPEQAIPYIEHVQRDPSMEEMCEVVAVKCVRPTHNPLWLTKRQFSNLYDIVRGSWVSHPAARLTAYNFRSRIDTLQSDVLGNRLVRLADRNAVERNSVRSDNVPLLHQDN